MMAYDGILNVTQEEILSKVLGSQHLCKLLFYPDNTKPVDTNTNLTGKQKAEMKNTKLFSYKRIPVSESDTLGTYLACEYGNINYNNRRNLGFVPMGYYFYIVSHQDVVYNTYDGNRVNSIEVELKNILHQQEVGNTCRLKILDSSTLNIGNGYVGRCVIFETIDFDSEKLG